MRTEYHKLVRDRIPEIIRRHGRACETEILSDEAYRQALLEKLREEAQEAIAGGAGQLVTELADIYEVIDAIMAAFGIEREVVLAEQAKKRAQRGAFEERIRLLWAEG